LWIGKGIGKETLTGGLPDVVSANLTVRETETEEKVATAIASGNVSVTEMARTTEKGEERETMIWRTLRMLKGRDAMKFL
jgi:hypothetical protein